MVVEQMETGKVAVAWGRQVDKWEARGPGYGRPEVPCLLSKKFLWEELELVREEVTFIYQKLRECPKPMAGRAGWRSFYSFGPLKSPPPTEAQEQEITENLVNIQKMQKTQVKCRKVSRAGWGGRGTLCELGYGDLCWPLLSYCSQKAWVQISVLVLTVM